MSIVRVLYLHSIAYPNNSQYGQGVPPPNAGGGPGYDIRDLANVNTSEPPPGADPQSIYCNISMKNITDFPFEGYGSFPPR